MMKFFENIVDFFNRKTPLKKGDLVAVNSGDFVGQFFVFIKKDGDDYIFLSIPEIKIQRVPKEKFDFAKKHEIIDYVERLPRNIFKVVKAQYEALEEKEDRNSE